MELTQNVGNLMYEKGTIGYVTIDLVSFQNQANGEPEYWAVDITQELNDYSTISLYFDIMMEGTFNYSSGEYMIQV